MRLDISMSTEKTEFTVSSWWAKTPEFAIDSLRSQLEAATVIWPELARYQITERASRKERGTSGGHARAAALTPERRSEIATKAAETRWKEQAVRTAKSTPQ